MDQMKQINRGVLEFHIKLTAEYMYGQVLIILSINQCAVI